MSSSCDDMDRLELTTMTLEQHDQTVQGATYFGGLKDELSQTYRFNIIRYVHDVLHEGYTNTLALRVPSSVKQPGGVFINHFANADTTGIRLHLLVSEE